MKRYPFFVIVTILSVFLLSSCGTVESSVQAAAPGNVPGGAAVSASPVMPKPPEVSEMPEEESPMPGEAVRDGDNSVFSPDILFTTTDRAGKLYDETVFSGYKLTILNFWEPWCGPCVREMPELEKLFEDYREKGLQIIGVYSTPDMEDDVDAVLESAGITFTILQYTDAFDVFQTGYVPTTVFINGEGKVIGEAYIGSRSYAAWENLIMEHLS